MENFKIKPLTKEQIIISIDRLTRFKNPETKYLRVFTEIITSNLIEPKYKKTDIEKMDYEKITQIAQTIINTSLEKLVNNCENDFTINQKLYNYEKTTFNINKETEKLLNNKINYFAFLNFIEKNSKNNLLWLKILYENKNLQHARKEYSLLYPIEKLIIVEGATEEILLPEFGKICGVDFEKEGIQVISAGGKNQVVKLYYKMQETLKLPIYVLLDKDAQENSEQIKLKLRTNDKIHLLECGEFEDLLSKDLLKRTLEYELNTISIIEADILEESHSRVELLEEVFKTRGRHEFKKAEFARLVKENIKTEKDLTPEMRTIIKEINTGIA